MEIEVIGKIDTKQNPVKENIFWNAIVDFVEGNGWYVGGAITPSGLDCVVDTDVHPASFSEFKNKFSEFIKDRKWDFEGTIKEI